MFRLTREEIEYFVRSKNLTSRGEAFFSGQDGGTRHLPYAFTEQGIYMLMTVLRGELATKQSRALIRLFKQLKDYALATSEILEYRSNLELTAKVLENKKDIELMRFDVDRLNKLANETDIKFDNITKTISKMVKKSELSPLVMDFTKLPERNEFLIMNGEVARANETYIDIYAKARKSIYVVDDYIDLKSLRQLQKVKSGVEIVIFSENLGNYLSRRDYWELKKEFPEIKIKFIKSNREFHDRFIVIDDEIKNARVYHCGASAKDAGKSLTMIMELAEDRNSNMVRKAVREMMKNGELVLK